MRQMNRDPDKTMNKREEPTAKEIAATAKEPGKSAKRLLSAANLTVRIVGSLIFAALTWYAFRYTQYIVPGGKEIPTNIKDSMGSNILAVVLAAAVFWCLFAWERRAGAKTQQTGIHAMLAAALIWIGVMGMWWIRAVNRVPEGDQAFLYGGASYFLEGNYDFLAKGGYCSMYPHQLGLIALTELLFLVTGSMNYFAFQVICVVLAMGIVWLGFRLVRHVTEHTAIAAAYCLMMMGCLPLIFYTGWVYGDIPSIFFSMLAADMLLLYAEKGKWGYLAGVVLSMSMAVLVRKNSLILLVAFFLTGGVYALWKKDRRILLSALLAALIPYIAYMGIYKMYEIRSGYEHMKGIPTLSWVSMGMRDEQGTYGWYYDYPKQIYYANDCSWEVSNEIVKQDIRERLYYFKQNPSYAMTFYREKILSQWNEPLYQSLYFSNKYVKEELRPAPDTLVSKISNEYFMNLLWFCDRMQFLVYLGILCYFLFGVKKNSNILQHLLAVAMIGGFFFSILWEAKARYILPYYVTMFPCAVIGYEQLIRSGAVLFHRLIKGSRNGRGEKIHKAA